METTIDGMTDAELDIKKILDKHGIWIANNRIVERTAFALDLLERYSDQLSNLKLGLTTVEELARDDPTG